jgi:RNA polymerase-binding transcription factor DksA
MVGSIDDAIEQRLQKDRDRLCEEAKAAESEDVRAKREIEEIEAALTRLADGRYGTCLGCGRGIPIERLRLLPATGYCVRCARRRARRLRAAVDAAKVEHPGSVPGDDFILSEVGAGVSPARAARRRLPT